MATATLTPPVAARPHVAAERSTVAEVQVPALTNKAADVQVGTMTLYLVSLLFVAMFLIVPLLLTLIGNAYA